ncbi:MAG: tetratricopeptide repeat protein [Candidatus Schekmanbacteria bacterium]|nr:tetratricopeptide repeat protein [Candidatus Schekmanbacteria bacterium]
MSRKQGPPSLTPEAILERGNEYLDAGEIEEAKRCFEEAIGLSPDFADAYVNLALIYFDHREFVAAKVLFERALDLIDRRDRAEGRRGEEDAKPAGRRARRRRGEEAPVSPAAPPTAAPAALAIPKANPATENLVLRALHGIGLCGYWLGNYSEALAVYHEMLGRDPSDSMGVRYLVGELYHRLGQLHKALASYAANPDDPHVAYNHALALHSMGRTREATEQILRAFFVNLYIAAFLLNDNRPWIRSAKQWHVSSVQWPDLAVQYIELCADLWQETPGATAFLNQVWRDGETQRAVENFILTATRLAQEPDFRRRSELQQRIADMQSDEIVSELAANINRRFVS